MLADVLAASRKRVAEQVENRAAVTEGFGLHAHGRRHRIDALIGDLIESLRRGGVGYQIPSHVVIDDQALEGTERQLVGNYLIEELEQHHLDASPVEAATVSEWACSPELGRLHAENQQLRALLDSVAESAAIFSPDRRIQYLNRPAALALHQLSRMPPADMLGKRLSEILQISWHQIGLTGDLVARARARDSIETEVFGRAKEYQFDALYAPDGSVAAVAVVGQDTQARKLAQRRVDLLSKLSMLIGTLSFEQVTEGLAQVPIPELADCCAVSLLEDNKVSQTFIAHRDPSKTPLREALMRVFHDEDRHPLWQELQTSGFQLLAEVTDDLVRRMVKSDALYRIVSQVGIRSLLVVPLVRRGQINGVLTLGYTDQSGRRYGHDDPATAEELAVHMAHIIENARLLNELKAGEARFRIALSTARTVVYEQDRSLRYLWYYNPLANIDVIGKTHEEVYPPEDAALLTELKRRVLDTDQPICQELDLILTGAPRHFRETVEPVHDPSGELVGVIGASTDITEQQHAQKQLAEELRFREQMMGILGHDLRNPLSAILMAASLVSQRQDLPAGARDQIVPLLRAANRMKEMIATLLDFVRVRFFGKLPLSPAPTDLGELSREVIEELRAAWPNHAIELDVQGDMQGEWDPARMSQMLCNLVSNAITYGDPKTPVRVSIVPEGADVTLKVSNRGPPISPDLLPKVFEPFRRGVPEDHSPGGLGLGLYVVQQIVLAHAGTIDVESTAEHGTTFAVRIPRVVTSPTGRGSEGRTGSGLR